MSRPILGQEFNLVYTSLHGVGIRTRAVCGHDGRESVEIWAWGEPTAPRNAIQV